MLANFIVNSYRIFVEICLWLSLVWFLIVGWNFQILIGEDFPVLSGLLFVKSISGLKGAIVGALAWFFFAIVFLARFLMLGDIRTRLKNIEEHQKNERSE